MRIMPFMKRKKGVQFAGIGIDSGGGDTSALANKTDLTAIILTGTTNTSGNVISAGAWFYLNGTPCVAKVDIASGATFTEGTNYEEKTVGSALTELNSKIGNCTVNRYEASSVTLSTSPTRIEVDVPSGEHLRYVSGCIYGDEPRNISIFCSVVSSNAFKVMSSAVYTGTVEFLYAYN